MDFVNHSCFHRIINTSHAGIWLLNDAFELIDANETACGYFGFESREAMLRSPIPDLIGDKAFETCFTHPFIREGKEQFECQLRIGTSKRSVKMQTTLLIDDGERFYISHLNDISDLKALETRITEEVAKTSAIEEKLKEQARLASMSEMIENIAHQWRQPLNILALVMQDIYIHAQLGSLSTEKIEENYDKANNVLQYMSQTIDDFRNLFNHSSDLKPFSIHQAIDVACKLVKDALDSHKIECRFTNVFDATVLGSENEFLQVIINIINNAKDALSERKVAGGYIEISMEHQISKVVLHIRDNAGGIPEKIMGKIFDPYFSTKNRSMGTGIGLYMSKQIVENVMQGSLKVFNEEEGARFEITVPVVNR